MASNLTAGRLPLELFSFILQLISSRRDLLSIRLVNVQLKEEIERILDRDVRIFFNPELNFPPRASLDALFRNEGRAARIRSLSVHTDYRTADIVRLALENAVNLTALTLQFTSLDHGNDDSSETIMIRVRGPVVDTPHGPMSSMRLVKKSITPFSDYVPTNPHFTLDYFDTNHPGYESDALERFVRSQPHISCLGNHMSNLAPISIELFPNLSALSAANAEDIVEFGLKGQLRALYYRAGHLQLQDILWLLCRRTNQLCLPSVISVSVWLWQDLNGFEILFPNLQYLQVYAQPSTQFESHRNTFKYLNRIRISWILPTSDLIWDFFDWFPSLQILEVLDKEDVYISIWTRNPAGEVYKLREEIARPHEWSTWINDP